MMRRAWFILVLMLIATGAAAVGVWRAAPKFAGDADADVFPLAGWAVVLCGAIALGLVALAAWAVWRGRKLAVAAGLSLLLCAASAIVWARGRRGDAFNVNWCGTAGPPPEQDPAWRDPRTDPPDEPVEGKTPDATVVRVWPGGITINRGHAEPLWWSGVRLEVYDRSMAGAAALPRRGKAVAYVLNGMGADGSVCHISGESAGWPVRVGDVVAAEAFKPGAWRRYFVVGLFDFDGDGRFQLSEGSVVGQAARLVGGRPVGSVAEADVVVLGREPAPYVPPPYFAHLPIDSYERWVADQPEEYRRAAAFAKEKGLPVVDQEWVKRVLGYPAYMKYPPVPWRSLRIDSGDGRIRLLYWSSVDWRERRPRWMINWDRPARPGLPSPPWPVLLSPGREPLWRRLGFAADYASGPGPEVRPPTGHPVTGRQWGLALTLPYWALAGLFSVLPLAWLARAGRCAARRRRARRGMCEACGYDLRASREAGRCPECGQAIKA